jgi:hypothetical protein
LLEPPIAPLAFGRVDRLGIAVAGIKLPQQGADHGGLILLHYMPKGIDRHAARLNQRDAFGAVIRPMQNSRNVRRPELFAVAQELRAQ